MIPLNILRSAGPPKLVQVERKGKTHYRIMSGMYSYKLNTPTANWHYMVAIWWVQHTRIFHPQWQVATTHVDAICTRPRSKEIKISAKEKWWKGKQGMKQRSYICNHINPSVQQLISTTSRLSFRRNQCTGILDLHTQVIKTHVDAICTWEKCN